ncbi:MAG TPA: PQQ-binding-like beta-propeller repeat protein, partial [Terriglobia bacterium]|nr:PQQ-binding-like beta-propeller repeat protein [Terriglobia bacterium]
MKTRFGVLLAITLFGFVGNQIPARVTSAQSVTPRQAPAVTFSRILRADQEPQNWLTYSGTLRGERYSKLTQITPANVKNLEIAWLWQAQSEHSFEATPLVVDGVLYTVQAPNDVVALNAATGRVLWKYPYTPKSFRVCCGQVNRGLAIHGDTLFIGTLDAHLLAIDAVIGKLVWDAIVANPDDPACRPRFNCYSITHAPLVVKDKVIVGTAGGDGWIRAFIAAFDVNTGKEAWRFYTTPATGEPGNETWSGDSWKTGGAAVWVTGAYDAEANLTYWGTGNPNPNGDPDARLGDNLYSDSVVALDADTGKLQWYFQFTPHDDMDWDSAQVPVLADIEWQGRPRKVMLWPNRNGLLYVLDRITGEFLMGKPFVEVNWMDGFDEKGRPLRRPGMTRRLTNAGLGAKGDNPIKPGSATNWPPPSYSLSTGLLYTGAHERPDTPFSAPASPSFSAIRAFDPQNLEMK